MSTIALLHIRHWI